MSPTVDSFDDIFSRCNTPNQQFDVSLNAISFPNQFILDSKNNNNQLISMNKTQLVLGGIYIYLSMHLVQLTISFWGFGC